MISRSDHKMQGAAVAAAPLPNIRDIRTVECAALSWIVTLLLEKYYSDGSWRGYGIAAVMAICLLSGVCLLCRFSSKRMLSCAAGALLALGVWCGYTEGYAKPLLALDGKNTVISGVVSDQCIYDSGTVRYTVSVNDAGRMFPVYWYAPHPAEAEVVPQIGDKVTVEAVFSALDSDYAAGENVFLSLYKVTLLETEQTGLYAIKRIVRGYREICAARIRQHLPQETASLLLAMLFGDDRGLSEEYASALYRTGIGHITAVSGLHLVFFCTALTWLLQRLRFSAKWIFAGNIAAAMLFSIMVDSAVSIQRAACMLLLSLAAPIFGRKKDAARSLCIAMLICTLPAPYVIGSASFWLSVSGVFGLTILAPYMRSRRRTATKGLRKLWQGLRNRLSPMVWVWVAVMPASILLCGETSLLSPIANLLLIPCCTAALGLGLLSVCLGAFGVIFLPFADGLCRLVLMAARLLAKLPHAYVTVSDSSSKALLILLVAVILLLALLHRDRRVIQTAILIAAAILLLQLAHLQTAQREQLRVAVLGDSDELVLVCSVDGNVVIADCSGALDNAACAADYLAAAGFQSVDMLLLPTVQNAAAYTHALEGVKVARVYLADGTGWRDGAAICGTEPVGAPEDVIQIQCGALLLALQKKQCLLEWNGISVIAIPADAVCENTYTAAIRYDGVTQTADDCDVFVSTNDASEVGYGRNTLLSFTDAQNCLVEILPE